MSTVGALNHDGTPFTPMSPDLVRIRTTESPPTDRIFIPPVAKRHHLRCKTGSEDAGFETGDLLSVYQPWMGLPVFTVSIGRGTGCVWFERAHFYAARVLNVSKMGN